MKDLLSVFLSLRPFKPICHFFESGICSLLQRNGGERGGHPSVDTLFLKLNVSG